MFAHGLADVVSAMHGGAIHLGGLCGSHAIRSIMVYQCIALGKPPLNCSCLGRIMPELKASECAKHNLTCFRPGLSSLEVMGRRKIKSRAEHSRRQLLQCGIWRFALTRLVRTSHSIKRYRIYYITRRVLKALSARLQREHHSRAFLLPFQAPWQELPMSRQREIYPTHSQ